MHSGPYARNYGGLPERDQGLTHVCEARRPRLVGPYTPNPLAAGLFLSQPGGSERRSTRPLCLKAVRLARRRLALVISHLQ